MGRGVMAEHPLAEIALSQDVTGSTILYDVKQVLAKTKGLEKQQTN
jgi:DNA-binding CsgD family transcriptional regulator